MTRESNKLRYEQNQADFEKRDAFITSSLNDLVSKNTTLEQVTANPLWNEILDSDKAIIRIMASAARAGDVDLIDLIKAHHQRSLHNLEGDCNYALLVWIKGMSDPTGFALFNEIRTASFCAEWERNAAEGRIRLEKVQFELIQRRRQKVQDLRAKFEAAHPDLYQKKRAARRNQSKTLQREGE